MMYLLATRMFLLAIMMYLLATMVNGVQLLVLTALTYLDIIHSYYIPFPQLWKLVLCEEDLGNYMRVSQQQQQYTAGQSTKKHDDVTELFIENR